MATSGEGDALPLAPAAPLEFSSDEKLRGGLRRSPKRFESNASVERRLERATERDMEAGEAPTLGLAEDDADDSTASSLDSDGESGEELDIPHPPWLAGDTSEVRDP